MVAAYSDRIRSSSCTTESGGSPPSFFESDIEPRVGAKRMPNRRRLELETGDVFF
jgi:hypothetical protein